MATRNPEESPNQEEEEEEEGTPQNKRPKTQTPNRPSPTKGKKKMEEEDACGICLCEEGKAMRGYIDSCNHYFCFVCIMEWAKVESRCPLCKRRFAAIRRPVKDGVFAVERVVNVPLRDQVCHNYGNATAGTPDPYSEVQCTVCLNTSNDSLLLLCDLCDSASHTYCVGLGTTVPEGDWFCQDCTLLRDEHLKDDQVPDYDSEFGSKPIPNYVNQTQSEEFSQIPSAETHVSIFDIVREPSLRDGHESSPNRSRKLSVVPEKRESRPDTVTDNGSVEKFFFRRGASQLGARTLGHCRSVHGHIRALRENWNGLRHGSFSFSSIGNQRCVSLEQHRKSGQSNSSSFLSQQSTPRNGSPSKMLPNSGSEDIDKAWKMMNVAKSIEKVRRKPNTVHRASKGSENPLRKVNTPKQTDSGSSKILTSYIGNKDRIGKYNQYCASVKTNDRNKYHMFEGEKPHGIPRCPEGSSASHSIVFSELSSSIVVQDSLEVGICNGNSSGDLLQNEFLGTLPNVINERDEGNILLHVSENNSRAKEKLHASSSSNLKGKNKVKKDCFEYKSKKDDDAKCEIQSLVKLNLKLLSKDKNLETVVFKEVARLATHSILAACGIGHPKPGVRSFPSSVCSHGDDNQQVRRSTLMPNSCRECFFVFVKDVVNSIMLEKLS